MITRMHYGCGPPVKLVAFLLSLLVVGCSGSPTAPTPIAPPVAVTPPVVTPSPPPAAVTPPPAFPPSDPRFDLAFYRMFVHDGTRPLRRQATAPRIYLRTIDDAGAPMDAVTLNETARALEQTVSQLTGQNSAGVERGTDTREGSPGWITVRWSQFPNDRDPSYSYCGLAQIAGNVLMLFPRSRWCRCGGGPAVVLSIVKHELGHALGFYHTDSREDLMFPTYSACDQQPSARERFHGPLAYQRPIGSAAP